MYKYLILLTCFLLFFSCMGQADRDTELDAMIKKYCVQKIELRDSLYIVYTVKS